MVSKNQIKLITSLQQKKYRNQHKLFIAEGKKVIEEFLFADFSLHSLFTTNEDFVELSPSKRHEISEVDLKKISCLTTPNASLAIFEIPSMEPSENTGLIVALDQVRDPGNLGTIIRLCDWFGVNKIICSMNTVDCYNPKVVQATMGSLARVVLEYCDLTEYLTETNLPVYAAMMDGENVYHTSLPNQAILVMGNEANGVSQEVLNKITHSITIPRFGDLQQTESLNVATATAILLSEFRRG
ncbi:TrmH family RNA methyltransferase [Imtechella halotolerans]|uniref:tRNA/rRNA methyltransferase SpoU n=1 Tax=Imtechella halotolerans K1 TaxID=946077 RepID=I0WHA9_9FLAO|nr:RNA methyltransferase [Imtechella halotolerans]EID75775.1 tRNA/rRNA methyltransferase SpoU [Imtechella halotolerans K1]WMQ63398.1 RNA methyltransferase [Imtechella halotolerans]